MFEFSLLTGNQMLEIELLGWFMILNMVPKYLNKDVSSCTFIFFFLPLTIFEISQFYLKGSLNDFHGMGGFATLIVSIGAGNF